MRLELTELMNAKSFPDNCNKQTNKQANYIRTAHIYLSVSIVFRYNCFQMKIAENEYQSAWPVPILNRNAFACVRVMKSNENGKHNKVTKAKTRTHAQNLNQTKS